MKFLIRIFFLLIISVLFFNNIEKEFVCPVECENDKHEVIFDKQLSDYKDCVLKNVFEKPSLSRTITYSSPTASVRTVNSLKKISNNLSIVNAVKTENYALFNPASSINVLSKDYASCCLLLAEYIDLAGFNRSNKYSIQGYMD